MQVECTPRTTEMGGRTVCRGEVNGYPARCTRQDRSQRRWPSIRDGVFPQLCGSPYAVKATYNLFKHEEATPENIQAGHRAFVLEAMRQPGVYLLLEDTTELSWSGKQAIAGLGPIGNSAAGLQGFFLHTVLSVRWHRRPAGQTAQRQPVEVLGIGDQQYYVRTPCRQPRESSQERLKRARESQVWPQASQRLGRAPARRAVDQGGRSRSGHL